MIQLSRKHLFYLTSLLIFLIASPPACGADIAPSSQAALLSINGTAFLDEDSDTAFSVGEAGVSGVTVRLLKNDSEIASQITDQSGQYTFAGIASGGYSVLVDSSDNLTTPASGRYDVNLSNLPALFMDFGYSSPPETDASTSVRQYPIMHPTAQMLTSWSGQYNASKAAYISPDISAKLASEAPKSYSLLDQIPYVPSERDQGQCGNCWAWAATGVMEADYARQMNVSDRFSVQYISSKFNGGMGQNGACCGGWLTDAADFYSSEGFAVPWNNTNAGYQDGSTECGSSSAVSASAISTSPNYPIKSISAVNIPTHGISSDKAIDNIKNILLQKKAVWFAFFLPDSSSWNSFFSFWGSDPESAIWKPDSFCSRSYSFSTGGGHAVLCVGYDETDPSNPYWIMLNSWGVTPERPSGLFRVKMDTNYNCAYSGLGYAFYWMTLDMSYPEQQADNSPPDSPAAPQGPARGTVGTPLTYSASSSDADGDPVTITFDWKDAATTDSQQVGSGEVVSLSHAWSRTASYAVVARATDSHGSSSDWSKPLTVKIAANGAPNKPAKLQGPATGRAEQSYSFTSSSTDPDGDDVRLIINWGDGSQSTTNMTASGQTAIATHSWTKAGSYSLRARAEDGKGGQSSWSAYSRVKISGSKNSPPNKPATLSGTSSGVTGKSYTYLAKTIDPDGDQIRYTIDWGDGNSTKTNAADSGTIASVAHTWSQKGAYQIRVKATDANGAESLWSYTKRVKIYASASSIPGEPSASRQDQSDKKSCDCQKD